MNFALLLFASLLCYSVSSVPIPAGSRTSENQTLSDRLSLRLSFEPRSEHFYPVEEYGALTQQLLHVLHRKPSDQTLGRTIVRLPHSDPTKPQVQAGIYAPQRGRGSAGGEHPFTNQEADFLLREVGAHFTTMKEKLRNVGRGSSVPNVCWHAFLGGDIFSVARGWYGGWSSEPLVSPCDYLGLGDS